MFIFVSKTHLGGEGRSASSSAHTAVLPNWPTLGGVVDLLAVSAKLMNPCRGRSASSSATQLFCQTDKQFYKFELLRNTNKW